MFDYLLKFKKGLQSAYEENRLSNCRELRRISKRKVDLILERPLDETPKVSEYTSNEKEQGINILIGERTWRLMATVITTRRW